jgi:glucose/arabinose dehydrogenase
LPEQHRGGAFIGEHGSWDRWPLTGYKVVFAPFANGRPAGMPMDILSGFVDQDGRVLGRPVGVVVDKHGSLLVADDVGNMMWRVKPAESKSVVVQDGHCTSPRDHAFREIWGVPSGRHPGCRAAG